MKKVFDDIRAEADLMSVMSPGLGCKAVRALTDRLWLWKDAKPEDARNSSLLRNTLIQIGAVAARIVMDVCDPESDGRLMYETLPYLEPRP